MIVRFGDEGTRDVFLGTNSKAARRRLPVDPWATARRKLDRLNHAAALLDLRDPPANRLEQLRGDRAGFYSVRINDQYRIVFQFEAGNASNVQIVDYH